DRTHEIHICCPQCPERPQYNNWLSSGFKSATICTAARRGVVTSTPLWRSQPYSLCIQCEYVHVRIQFLHYKFEISKKSLLLTDIIRVFPGQIFRVFPVSL